MSNLKQVGALMISYADDHGDRFPADPSPVPTAVGTFQELVDGNESFDSRVLVSPAQRDTPALADENGRLELREKNVSYAVLAPGGGTRDDPSTILASNDTYQGAPNQTAEPEGHRDGVTMIHVGGEASFLRIEDLDDGHSFPAGLIDGLGRRK